MARLLARRLLFAGVLIALTSSSALFLARLAPGDMTSQLGPFASPVDIENTRTRFNLDRSPISQWGLWVSRAMRLDFGESFLYNRPVAPLVVRAAGNTALLGVVSLLLATLVGLALGVFTGARSGTLPCSCAVCPWCVCRSLRSSHLSRWFFSPHEQGGCRPEAWCPRRPAIRRGPRGCSMFCGICRSL